MVASVAAMLNLLEGLWFDGELYKFHHWFHMIYIVIMQLRGASFILRMKSKLLLRSEVGVIMVSICLHGVISLSHAGVCGRFGPTKTITITAEKYHPFVLKFCLTWTVYNISNKMTKFYDDVYSFEPVRGCQFLKALHIHVSEMAGVTAMAAGGEQTQSAHACDVSLGARIITKNIRYLLWNRGFWCSLNNTYPIFLTLCIRCTNHLCDSCDLTNVNPHFIPSLLRMIKNVDLLWRHRYKSRPPAIVMSQWPIFPAWLLWTLS